MGLIVCSHHRETRGAARAEDNRMCKYSVIKINMKTPRHKRPENLNYRPLHPFSHRKTMRHHPNDLPFGMFRHVFPLPNLSFGDAIEALSSREKIVIATRLLSFRKPYFVNIIQVAEYQSHKNGSFGRYFSRETGLQGKEMGQENHFFNIFGQ